MLKKTTILKVFCSILFYFVIGQISLFGQIIHVNNTDSIFKRNDTTFHYHGKVLKNLTVERNDTTFYYNDGRLSTISIKLSKNRSKGVSYYRSGKIESIWFSRPNKAGNGYEYYGKWLGFYESGAIRFKVIQKHGRHKLSYFYFPNGKIQCKTYWDRNNDKKKIKFFDENGNKISINYQPNPNDHRVDECE